MKKLVISYGDDEAKTITASFTLTLLELPNGESGYLLFRDYHTPKAFVTLSDAFIEVCEQLDL